MTNSYVEEFLSIAWWALAVPCWYLGYLWFAIPASALGVLALAHAYVSRRRENLENELEEKNNGPGRISIDLHTMN